MGGRGSSSGMTGESSGFSYKSRGKTVIVQRTSTGVMFVNGSPSTLDYNKLKQSAKKQEGYKELSAADLEKIREERYKNYTSKDYELLDDTRGKRKSIYRPRRRW